MSLLDAPERIVPICHLAQLGGAGPLATRRQSVATQPETWPQVSVRCGPVWVVPETAWRCVRRILLACGMPLLPRPDAGDRLVDWSPLTRIGLGQLVPPPDSPLSATVAGRRAPVTLRLVDPDAIDAVLLAEDLRKQGQVELSVACAAQAGDEPQTLSQAQSQAVSQMQAENSPALIEAWCTSRVGAPLVLGASPLDPRPSMDPGFVADA